MKISILKECGHNEALLGLGLSYGITGDTELSAIDNFRLDDVALRLAPKDGGHNKFLESIQVWLDVTAPRYWWQEADTYRLSTKQSASTMHTIGRRYLEQSDFAMPIDDTNLMKINELVAQYGSTKTIESLIQLKNMLPEGFLQRRIWNVNYKVLRNIIQQRQNHRLPEWKQFCEHMMNNLLWNEYLK